MKLTKEQEEFWDVLKYPYIRNCDNCLHKRQVSLTTPCMDCAWIYSKFAMSSGNGRRRKPSNWQWEHETN